MIQIRRVSFCEHQNPQNEFNAENIIQSVVQPEDCRCAPMLQFFCMPPGGTSMYVQNVPNFPKFEKIGIKVCERHLVYLQAQ